MAWLVFVTTLGMLAFGGAAPQELGGARRATAPESFRATAQVVGLAGASATAITIKIDKYSADKDREFVEQALKTGGHAAFIEALRKAPVVGSLTIAGNTFDIRFAREERTANGRNILLVTDKPVFFVGGGATNAKPREGYDVAMLKFRMDDGGIGYNGTMTAAAKVKTGATGVEIDDYAEKPIELRTVTREFK